MTRQISLLITAIICMSTAKGQELRLNGYFNYVFDDKFDTYESSTSFLNGKILGGLQWGAGLEYIPYSNVGFEVLYIRQDTKIPVNYYQSGDVSRRLDVNINYILLGGTHYRHLNEAVEGYGGLVFGAVLYNNEEPLPNEPSDVVRFAWGFRLGGNYFIDSNLGIKIQMLLLSAVQSMGGGFYFGTGGGGAGVSTYSTLFQFSLGGGLVYRLGQ